MLINCPGFDYLFYCCLASLQNCWWVLGPFLLLTDVTLNSTCLTIWQLLWLQRKLLTLCNFVQDWNHYIISKCWSIILVLAALFYISIVVQHCCRIAGALSGADRCHFELNLSALLDKSTQCKRNLLHNVLAARQRFERQQANFKNIQTLSVANSRWIKWMTAGKTSQCMPSTLPPPTAPPSGHMLAPRQQGPKDAFSSAEDNLCDHSEQSSSHRWTLQLLHKTSKTASAPTDRSTPAKCSTMEFPRCGSICCGAY